MHLLKCVKFSKVKVIVDNKCIVLVEINWFIISNIYCFSFYLIK